VGLDGFAHLASARSISRAFRAPYYADTLNVVPDGKSGYWFGARVILTGSTWAMEQVPSFSGGYGGVTRIPGTTSFLQPAGLATGSSSTEKQRSSGSTCSYLP
jgi:hypothetical protein